MTKFHFAYYFQQSKKDEELVKHFFEMKIEKIIENAEAGKIPFVVAVRKACRMFLKYEGKHKMNTLNCISF